MNNILIIDDEAANLSAIVDFLASQNFEVVIANSGVEGITRARLGRPDLILLDVHMPGMDGYETCHNLKADPLICDIPIIFMTGQSEIDSKLKAFAVGAVDCVTKPIQPSELLARLYVQLKLRNRQRELAEKNERLKEALDTGNSVNVAIGVLMERQRISRDAAFEIIRKRARAERRRVADIATEFLAASGAVSDDLEATLLSDDKNN